MERKRFTIPQVEDKSLNKPAVPASNIQNNNRVLEEQRQEKKPAFDRFVSSWSGTNVKDVDYVPSPEFGNNGKQYDSFRNKGITEADYRGYCYSPEESGFSSKKMRNDLGSSVFERNENNIPEYLKVGNDNEVLGNNNRNNEYEELNQYREEVSQNKNDFQNENVYNPYTRNEEESSIEYAEVKSNEDLDDDLAFERATEEIKDANDGRIPRSRKYEEMPKKEKKSKYIAPPLSILKRKSSAAIDNYSGVQKQRDIIDNTLAEFGIGGRVTKYTKGPTVTLFEVSLDPGVKYQRIPQIQSNLQGNLEAISIRIEAPIPGKASVGIEVPNIDRDMVFFGDMICDEKFLNDGKPLNVVLGMNISGQPEYLDLTTMPHGLIAGATGSGKSVCINSIIASIIYKAHPDDVKLILIDPKKVEFAKFKGIPHLATPIVTDTKLAISTLRWAVDEMENRYELFAAVGASKYTEYLELTGCTKDTKHIPYIVIIIDELADLMQTGGSDVEESIMRITAKARAAGIHLIVATQRPSVNVINGTIKTNIPTRIAFKVNKALDSNIILDRAGAEKLLGNGDMLYIDEMGTDERIQGAYISGSEIKELVSYIDDTGSSYIFTSEDIQKKFEANGDGGALEDDLFVDIARYIVETQNASINKIQKVFNCGFNRIQAIVQKLEELGVVSENLGSRARNVLVEADELEDILDNL